MIMRLVASIALVVLGCLVVSTSDAAVRYVPYTYPTIQSALDSAQIYDTVLVGPGTYVGSLNFQGKDIRLISLSGPAATTLQAQEIIIAAWNITRYAQISGFRITRSHIVLEWGASPTISENIFDRGSREAIYCRTGSPLITRNLFKNSEAISCIGMGQGAAVITNNTFINNARGMYCGSSQAIVMNNIVANNRDYGFYGTYGILDYNNVWHNGDDYVQCTPGPHDISADPLLVDTAGGDFSPLAGSQCIDAGHPDPVYNDPDGSRADIGAFPRTDGQPWVTNIGVLGQSHLRVVSAQPIFTWNVVGEPSMQQLAYECQVGTDNEWKFAELWKSGEVASTEAYAQYAGPPLLPGDEFYVRARVSLGTVWGAWSSRILRRNVRPEPPTPTKPANNSIVPTWNIYYQIGERFDADGDIVTCTGYIYDDPDLDVPIDSVTFEYPADLPDVPLASGRQYWWRVRAHDGHEYSDWSSVSSFYTKANSVIHVPDDFSGIQAAIDGAIPGDTILVSPGLYTDNIDFRGMPIVLQSTHGASVTRLRPRIRTGYAVEISYAWPADPPLPLEFSGFTLDSMTGIGVYVNWAHNLIIRDNVFRDNSNGPSVTIYGQGTPLVTRNVFFHNNDWALHCADSVLVVNNTFALNQRALGCASGREVIRNNIIANSEWYNIEGRPAFCDYNDVWGAQESYYYGAAPGPHDIQLDPKFLDTYTGDLRLMPGSPCIDAGDPDVLYDDPDGTRADMGAIYTHVQTPATNMIRMLGGNPPVYLDPARVTVTSPTITWEYRPYAPVPTAHELRVSRPDSPWQGEVWSTGELAGRGGSAIYAGAALLEGHEYILEIREKGASEWGSWARMAFHMNSRPGVPQLVAPADGGELVAHPATLSAYSTDEENDPRRYDFEVYSDCALTNRVAEYPGVAGGIAKATTPVLPILSQGATYWWRCRANDGAFYSDWSTVSSFVTRYARTVHVPGDFSSIQLAVDSSGFGDTILVGPGNHTGSTDLKGRHLRIISTHGPQATTLNPSNGPTFSIKNGEGEITEIAGFTIFSSSHAIIAHNNSRPTIRGNIFRQTGGDYGVIQCENSDPLITQNLFYDIGGIACIGIGSGTARILDNTMDRCGRGVVTLSGRGVLRGNSITNCVVYGAYGYFHSADYNNMWNNGTNYMEGPGGGQHDISVNPLFCNVIAADYHLSSMSPCLGAGFQGVNIGAFEVGCPSPTGCDCHCHGDPRCDGYLNVLDVVDVIDQVLRGAPLIRDATCTVYGTFVDSRCDLNCDGMTNIADVVLVIQVTFRRGDADSQICSPCP